MTMTFKENFFIIVITCVQDFLPSFKHVRMAAHRPAIKFNVCSVQACVCACTCPAVPATTSLLLYLHRVIFWMPSLGSSL